MAMMPESLLGNHAVDFRPPPSSVAPGRRSSFANDDDLTKYLQESLKVPDLVLPDRSFPRQKSIEKPPSIDFQNLESLENESGVRICESIVQVGCSEVVNLGISPDLMKLDLFLAGGIFGIPLEMKMKSFLVWRRRHARTNPKRHRGDGTRSEAAHRGDHGIRSEAARLRQSLSSWKPIELGKKREEEGEK